MAYSRITYTGTGSTVNYPFPFTYIDKTDIYVFVDGVSVAFAFLNTSTVSLTQVPIAGSVVQVRRVTQKLSAPVVFTDGSVLLKKDLDLLATYTLFIAQEDADYLAGSVTQDTLQRLDAQSLRIINLAPGTGPTDAVNKAQNDATVLAAAAAASSASTSASQAAASAALAQSSGSAVTLQATLTSSSGAANVGVIAAGTGAVKRTLQDAIRDVVSVKGFGALGNGTTDDSAAFTAAIASVSGNTVEVILPIGNYILNSPVDVAGKNVCYLADASVTVNNFAYLNGTLQRPQRIVRDTYGILDNGAGFSVMTNLGDNQAQVLGFTAPSQISTVEDRDSVAFYVQNNGRGPGFTTSSSTYTATSVVSATAAGVGEPKVGMLMDTQHVPKFSGQVTAISADRKTFTVSGWYAQGNAAAGQVPPNTANARLNPTTKIWGLNANVQLVPGNEATRMTGFELGVVNNVTPWTFGSLNTSWGYDCNNLGTYRSEVAFVQRGDFYYGFSSRGASQAAFHVANQGATPNYGLLIEKDTPNPVMFSPGGVQRFAVNQNGSLEIGSVAVASASTIDFHTSSNNIDYDARILATGGTAVNGKATLRLESAFLELTGLGKTGTTPAAGGAGVLPATPAGYVQVVLDGVIRLIAFY